MPTIGITRVADQPHESVLGIREDTSSRGVDLAGARVTATFADGTSETHTWVALDPYTNGGITGTDFTMFFGFETHELKTTKLLTTLEIDLAPANSVFDTTLTMEDDLTGMNTPTSKNGFPFLVTPEYQGLAGTIEATYSGIVNLVNRPADGDLFTTMLIDFSGLASGGVDGDIDWNSDIDTMRTPGDLVPLSALGVTLVSGGTLSEFTTLAAALAAAAEGDVINVGSAYAGGSETLATALNDVTFNLAGGAAPMITLTGSGAQNVTLQGAGGGSVISNGSANEITGGIGAQTVDYAASDAAVTVNLNNGAALGGYAAGDVLSGIDNLTGSDFADRLTGDLEDNVLTGGDGGDLLSGLTGADWLSGGLGLDSLSGGDGDDTLIGGADNDRLFGNNDNDSIDGGAGDDFTNGGAGDDTINGGADDDNVLVGGSGADSISGDAGNDGLNGSFGDDTLLGGTGDDRLFGGDGIDSLDGGADDDVLGGLADADVLNGGTGNDSLNGGGGNDDLHGDAGMDRIFGGTGDDTLNGGADDDLLIGQSGLDRFVFDAGWGNDQIAGYGSVTGGSALVDEVIDLSSLGIAFGDLTIETFGSGSLIYITADGSTDNSIEVLFRDTSQITEADFFFG